jgi:DNA-binding response OmpR family regulator
MRTLKKVLIVEDDQVFRTLLTEKLEAEGVEVLTTGDGKSGLDIALAEHPDLIWVDVMLPGITGIDMIKRLRADRWGSKACIVLLTQVLDPNFVAEALENGVFKYFIKADHSVEDVIDETKKYFSSLP